MQKICQSLANAYTSQIARFMGANMGPIWGRQDPGGPHVGPMNFAIWDCMDGWVQDCSNSSALAMELLQSCAKPSIYCYTKHNTCLVPSCLFPSFQFRSIRNQMPSIFSQKHTWKISFWWNFHHWLHWKLSIWQLLVQPMMRISVSVQQNYYLWCGTPKWSFWVFEFIQENWKCSLSHDIYMYMCV